MVLFLWRALSNAQSITLTLSWKLVLPSLQSMAVVLPFQSPQMYFLFIETPFPIFNGRYYISLRMIFLISLCIAGSANRLFQKLSNHFKATTPRIVMTFEWNHRLHEPGLLCPKSNSKNLLTWLHPRGKNSHLDTLKGKPKELKMQNMAQINQHNKPSFIHSTIISGAPRFSRRDKGKPGTYPVIGNLTWWWKDHF